MFIAVYYEVIAFKPRHTSLNHAVLGVPADSQYLCYKPQLIAHKFGYLMNIVHTQIVNK